MGKETFTVTAVRLVRRDDGACLVFIEHRGRWVRVIEDHGSLISHIVESEGIADAIARTDLTARGAKDANLQSRP